MMDDVRISMVQMSSGLGDVDGNLDKMADFIKASSGSDIICFPELCVTGYDSGRSIGYRMSLDDDAICRIRDLSAEHGMHIAFGFPEASDDGRTYIAHAIASPDGGVSAYRKTHLGRYERGSFSEGDSFFCQDLGNIKAGIEICWESHFPEISTCLRIKGAELILMPHASPMTAERRIRVWERYLPARAYDNKVFVAACNAILRKDGGGIMVTDPSGQTILKETSSEDKAVHCTLSSSSLERRSVHARDTMKGTDFFQGRRPELYEDVSKVLRIS